MFYTELNNHNHKRHIMAFIKKPMSDNDNRLLKDIHNDLENRTEEAFDATEIQSGSNSNGSWIKFPDGTMICYSPNLIQRPDGNERESGSWIYPAAFTNTPNITSFAGVAGTSTHLIGVGYNNSVTTRTVLGYVVENKYSSPLNIYLNFQAIGRWK